MSQGIAAKSYTKVAQKIEMNNEILLQLDDKMMQINDKIPTFDDSEIDYFSYFTEQYLSTILTSPLIVIETLVETQQLSQSPSQADTKNKLDHLVGLAESTKIIFESEEGWTCMFKGHLTHFIHKSLFQLTQPLLEELLNDCFDKDLNPITKISSHVVCGTLLYPLEIVRTRLIVQSSSNKKYYGMFHCFYHLLQEKAKRFAIIDLATGFYHPSHLQDYYFQLYW
jgi:hypothetical protein